MPYKSAKQRAYLHIHHPKLAAKWDKKYGGKIEKKKDKGFGHNICKALW
jgi:hypothetical protein